jgi:hypothetical protein
MLQELQIGLVVILVTQRLLRVMLKEQLTLLHMIEMPHNQMHRPLNQKLLLLLHMLLLQTKRKELGEQGVIILYKQLVLELLDLHRLLEEISLILLKLIGHNNQLFLGAQGREITHGA